MIPLAFIVTTLPPQTGLKGQALLDDLSKRAVQYFYAESHPVTGFTLDRGPNGAAPRNNAGISSVASTGYALCALAIGAERGWLDKAKAKERTLATLKHIPTIEGHRGWYYHFVNWETGKREWGSELSSIDSSLMFAGILMAKQAWNDPEVSKRADNILDKVDWKFFQTNDNKFPNYQSFSMGWNPQTGFLDSRWDGFYEHMFLYILAMGSRDDIEGTSWASFRRPGIDRYGYKALSDGALFMHQMSQGFFDFRNQRDYLGYDYWVEGRNATLINRQYCILNPNKRKGYGPDIWGLSACDIKTGYGAQSPWPDGDNGTLAPAAAVASVIYTPDLSTRAAEAFAKNYPSSYGRYGFTTGISPTEDWQSPDVIGIDIGQMLLCIENQRDGLAWKWMMSSDVAKKGFAKAGFRKTDEGAMDKRALRVWPMK